jgi:hypothetical protein
MLSGGINLKLSSSGIHPAPGRVRNPDIILLLITRESQRQRLSGVVFV